MSCFEFTDIIAEEDWLGLMTNGWQEQEFGDGDQLEDQGLFESNKRLCVSHDFSSSSLTFSVGSDATSISRPTHRTTSLTAKSSSRRQTASYHPYSMPRILKQDIRRQYATMWINTINYFDPAMIFHFLKRFSADTVEYEDQTRGREIFLEGASPIALLNGILMPMVPDMAVRLLDCKIVRSGDADCHIDFSLEVRGASVCHIPVAEILEDFAAELYPDHRQASSGEQGPPQIATHCPYKYFPVIQTPKPFTVRVEHRFQLDEQKRIQRIRLMAITKT